VDQGRNECNSLVSKERMAKYKLAPNPIPVSGRFLRFIPLVLRKNEMPNFDKLTIVLKQFEKSNCTENHQFFLETL
jgi:hypothetical protein